MLGRRAMTQVHARLTVREMLERFPASARVFIRYRMACVGCAMAPFDTLADASAAYGITPRAFLDALGSTLSPAYRKERV
jgi:hybrid cluster-associated redox disulfide protein